jgi:hypothetical protein
LTLRNCKTSAGVNRDAIARSGERGKVVARILRISSSPCRRPRAGLNDSGKGCGESRLDKRISRKENKHGGHFRCFSRRRKIFPGKARYHSRFLSHSSISRYLRARSKLSPGYSAKVKWKTVVPCQFSVLTILTSNDRMEFLLKSGALETNLNNEIPLTVRASESANDSALSAA